MGTRRNSKWTIIEFFIAVPLMLMACSLSSAIPAIGNKATQTENQVAPTAQQSGVQSTPNVTQVTTTALNTQDAANNPTPTVGPQAFDRTPKVQLPQTFTYADLTFSVTKADITNQVSATNPSIDPSNTYARLSIKIDNLNTYDVTILNGRFTLKLADGTSYTQDYIDKVSGNTSKNTALEFTVPTNETWSGAQLSLAEGKSVPGVVMLDGAQPTSQYPIKLTAGQKLSLTQSTPMTYTVKTAVMDLDGLGVRAQIGSHYLVLDMSAFCNNSNDCLVGLKEMRLIVDGNPESAETLVPYVADVHFQTTVDVQAAFVVPDNTANLVFEVGEVGNETAQTPIDFK